jgi:hypothetical protein
MNYRYIILRASSSGFGSGFGDEFDKKFNDNTWFISNYLSLQIRKLRIPSDGPYNMFYCNITKGEESVIMSSNSVLNVKIHLEESEINKYKKLNIEKERFEFYLSLLEKGYNLASITRDIPTNTFLKLHQEFRGNGYKNERLFKKKYLKDYGIKIELYHVLTSYSYNLVLSVFDLHGKIIGENSIFETFPDDLLYNKTVRNIVIMDDNLVITDFLNQPQFICKLDELSMGIIKSVCVDDNTRKYIPNMSNIAEFNNLKW